MCGIAGIFSYSSKQSIDHDLISRMCQVLHHRGPDAEGIYVNESIGLGHRRLSIIDLSDSAVQPMSNEDGTVWITFNGEIYNFNELHRELSAMGHIFKSKSDTEVIIHLYEEFGLNCLHKLRGMFAFGIWDSNKQTLLLARDQVGKKPLYYTIADGAILFSSEIKGLLATGIVEKKVNLRALELYMTLQYVPSPETMFSGVYKLPPASFLVANYQGISTDRYCHPEIEPQRIWSAEEVTDSLFSIIEEATRLRLISDVPLGAFLSGGVDSSLVVALASKITKAPIKTFSIGFREEDYSELPHARKVAQHLGTEHREFIVTPHILDILPTLIWHFNEPFGDSSAIPTYYLSKMTREYVTVALSGDGGDELFAGYTKYLALTQARTWANLVSLIPQNVYSKLPFPRCSYNEIQHSIPKRLWNNLCVKFLSTTDKNYCWIATASDRVKETVYSNYMKDEQTAFQGKDFYREELKKISGRTELDKILIFDFRYYLPDDLLVKVDVTSMANSLEVRCPLLDQNVVGIAQSISTDLKLAHSTSKYLLKRLALPLLPADIVKRPKKGFSVPIGNWLRNELNPVVKSILLDERTDASIYFNRNGIKKILDEHDNGMDHGAVIWMLLNFFLWHMMFIEERDITNLSTSWNVK